MSAPSATHPRVALVQQQRVALALMFIAPALWSVNYLVARWAPGVIAPHMLAFWRWIVGALILGVFCWREIVAKRSAIRAEVPQFIALGALGMWVCGAFVYIGARSTTAVNIGLLYAVSPVLIALFSARLLNEHFGLRAWAGVAFALAGVVHIVLRGHWTALADVNLNPGDAWIVVAMLCWSAYSLLLRAWPSVFGALARLTLIAVGGVIVLLPFTVIEALYWWPSTLSWRSVGLVLASALLPGAAAYGAYSFMQRVLGSARAGMVLYLGPIYAAAAAWLFLGEHIEAHHLVGAALILPGIWLSTRR